MLTFFKRIGKAIFWFGKVAIVAGTGICIGWTARGVHVEKNAWMQEVVAADQVSISQSYPAALIPVDQIHKSEQPVLVAQANTSSQPQPDPIQAVQESITTVAVEPEVIQIPIPPLEERRVARQGAQHLGSASTKVKQTGASSEFDEFAQRLPELLEQQIQNSGVRENAIIIQFGDTLGEIGRDESVSFESLAEKNNVEPTKIRAGEVIVKPGFQDDFQFDRHNRWNLLGTSKVGNVNIFNVISQFPVSEEVINGWTEQINDNKKYQIQIPWGTKFDMQTSRRKGQAVTYTDNVWGFWTRELPSGLWEPISSVKSDIWVTKIAEGNEDVYYVLTRVQNCKNLGWIEFRYPREEQPEQIKTSLQEPPPCEECKPAPECEKNECPAIPIITQEAPKKEWIKGIAQLSTNVGTSSFAQNGTTNGGSQLIVGVKLQGSKSIVGTEVKGETIIGGVINSSMAQNLEEQPSVTGGLYLSASATALGLQVTPMTILTPQKEVWDTVGVSTTWTAPLGDLLWLRLGHGYYRFNDTPDRSNAEYSGVDGRLGLKFGVNSIFGLAWRGFNFENKEIQIQDYPLYKGAPGLFFMLMRSNFSLDLTGGFLREDYLNKVDALESNYDVFRFDGTIRIEF